MKHRLTTSHLQRVKMYLDDEYVTAVGNHLQKFPELASCLPTMSQSRELVRIAATLEIRNFQNVVAFAYLSVRFGNDFSNSMIDVGRAVRDPFLNEWERIRLAFTLLRVPHINETESGTNG